MRSGRGRARRRPDARPWWAWRPVQRATDDSRTSRRGHSRPQERRRLAVQLWVASSHAAARSKPWRTRRAAGAVGSTSDMGDGCCWRACAKWRRTAAAQRGAWWDKVGWWGPRVHRPTIAAAGARTPAGGERGARKGRRGVRGQCRCSTCRRCIRRAAHAMRRVAHIMCARAAAALL